MFLKTLQERNPALVDAAAFLHQNGVIQPDTYLIDLDTLLENAEKLLSAGRRERIRLFFMLKQLGRNADIGHALMDMGYPGAVAVDFREALHLVKEGIPLAHVGHLVQVPDALLETILQAAPEWVTVYSLEKMERVNEVAKRLGIQQKICLRVQEGGLVYSGQEAGFSLQDLPQVARRGRALAHVSIAGVTTFPALLYQGKEQGLRPTVCGQRLKEAAERLASEGCSMQMINAPSATCIASLPTLSALGANVGEPGHGLTGTTPLHAQSRQPEKPCVVYVSEVSHRQGSLSYCFGGGHYRRSHVKRALVMGKDGHREACDVLPPALEAIDYHFGLRGTFAVGATVLMAFRYQIFVTRSEVVLLRGLSRGKVQICGRYDAQGQRKDNQ